MSQIVNFASPGTYALSFDLAQRNGKAILPITVSVDGIPISSVGYTATSLFGVNAFGPVVTAPFTINSSGNHTITLSATPSPGYDLEVLIDNISVAKSAPAVVLNRGFQAPGLSVGVHQYRPAGANWVFTGNAGVERDALNAPTAPEGAGLNSAAGPQAGFLQTAAAVAGGTDGAMTQQIEFAAPGAYSLAFKAATRTGKGNLPIRVLVNGVLVDTITPSSVTWADYTTAAFAIINPGYHSVQLAATPNSVMDNQAFIDCVVVNVPSATVTRPRPVPVAGAGFETPSPAVGHGLQPTGTPWTFSGTVPNGAASGVQSDGSSFGSYDGRHAPEGWQTAFFSSSGTNTSFGVVSQTINFPAAGSYVVGLQAQRGRAGANPVTITVDGVSVGTCSPPSAAFYPYTSNVFTVTAGNHTLTFTGSTASGVGVFTLIDAINIWPISTPVNLALNKAVTASSTVTSGGWGMAKLTDGVRGTTTASAGWSSNSNVSINHSEWAQVDLGAAVLISQVVLYPRDDAPNAGVGFPIDFSIAGSTNGTTWTTLVAQTGYSPSTPPTGAQTFTFPTGSYRYVRVTGTNLRIYGSIYRMQFAEMEVY
jgi:hypothetical protein